MKLFDLEENKVSFSQEQKKDIIAQPIKASCCKRALLQGLLATKGVVDDGVVTLSLDGAEIVEYVSELIPEIYSKTPDILTSKNGGRRKIISFQSKSAGQYITSFCSGDVTYSEKCPTCRSNFLRGMFLASGRVSDPAKQYSLEFSVKDREERVMQLFNDLGIVVKLSKKSNETLIYVRNSEIIEDFFAMAGMNNAAFDIMNAKIQGDLRNTANRIANCETNNIDRAVSASIPQIALIGELIDRGLISLLPEELEMTARFRYENDSMSLSQLAGAITPPISKSGLSHRLKKITEMAEVLLKKGSITDI